MNEPDDLEVRGLSLPRPLAGCIVPGPCRVVNTPALELPRLEGGLLVVIHAQERWLAEDLAAALVHWPDVPTDPNAHPAGLVGVGLLQRVEWYDAAAAVTQDAWAVGAWCLVLQDLVPFTRPVPYLGLQGLFQLPDQLANKIAGAWAGRPRR